jgi:hypothetical protein
MEANKKLPTWGPRKPLKRLDSDKEIQENPKALLWPTAPRPRRSALD